jgi:hypothetical protein
MSTTGGLRPVRARLRVTNNHNKDKLNQWERTDFVSLFV